MNLTAQPANKFARVATFTNISDETFVHTHCFDDSEPLTYSFEPGESQILPFVIANFLAKHLARKILLGNASSTAMTKRTKLFGDEDVDTLKAKILSGSTAVTPPRVQSTAEIVREQIAKLNPKDSEDISTSEDGDVETKATIIQAMKDKGMKVDLRKSKSELKKELMSYEPGSDEEDEEQTITLEDLPATISA